MEKAAAVNLNGWYRVTEDLIIEPRENEDTNLPPLIVLKYTSSVAVQRRIWGGQYKRRLMKYADIGYWVPISSTG